MRKIVLCILGTLTINCGPKVDGDRDSRGGTLIGPSGGVVEGPGGARIEIPAGALSEEVAIGIRLADSSDLEGINWSALETTVDDRFVTAEVTSFSFFQPGASAPEEDDGVEEAGDAYEVTPHGQSFNLPVRVRVPYRNRVAGLGLFRNGQGTTNGPTVKEGEGEVGTECEEAIVIGNLMWTPRSAEEGGLTCDGADRYCDQLSFASYSDWRVPTISELRTRINGCPATEPGGSCDTSQEYGEAFTREVGCEGCGSAGARSDNKLTCYGLCNLTCPCACNEYWSSTELCVDLGTKREKQNCPVRFVVRFGSARITAASCPWGIINRVSCVRNNR